ncbi:hypothetical protein ACS8Y6_16945 [Salinisphaera sp. RV14]|uniref:hypothetical protein n=1 Tax=Salinisphaera sp. RV14 TaxID=3454140 RepID=UPI003F82898F
MAAELSRELDAPDAETRQRQIKLHLLMCRNCRRYARQLNWMQQAFRLLRSADTATPGLPAAARSRIRQRLRDETPRPPV